MSHPYRIDFAVSRLLQLDAEGITNKEIADTLNLENHQTVTGRKFTIAIIAKILTTIRAGTASRYTIAAARTKVEAA